jgi:hypothetical protein
MWMEDLVGLWHVLTVFILVMNYLHKKNMSGIHFDADMNLEIWGLCNDIDLE